MSGLYYEDELVRLYHGDCREVTEWLEADVLVMDPPYGRAWKQGRLKAKHQADDSHAGIAGDLDTTVRDAILELWGDKPAIVFGDLMLAPPKGTKLVSVYRKQPNAGQRGAIAGVRRDAEAVYLLGPWPSGIGGRSSVFATASPSAGNPSSPQGRFGHPHAKPEDVMCQLVDLCPAGSVIADPTFGSGSGLVAARNMGHPRHRRRTRRSALPDRRRTPQPAGAGHLRGGRANPTTGCIVTCSDSVTDCETSQVRRYDRVLRGPRLCVKTRSPGAGNPGATTSVPLVLADGRQTHAV